MNTILMNSRPTLVQLPNFEGSAARMSRIAVASLAMSLLTAPFSIWEFVPNRYYQDNLPAITYTMIGASLALLLGIIGLWQIRRGKETLRGFGLALTGIILALIEAAICSSFVVQVLGL